MHVIKPWDVYHVDLGNGYKKKFFIPLLRVLVLEHGSTVTRWLGFYISSSPQYVGGLKGNDIAISSVVYGFLNKNSSINAGELNMHNESDLVEYRDYIRQGDRGQVFAVVEKSKTLEPEHIQSILALRPQPTVAI